MPVTSLGTAGYQQFPSQLSGFGDAVKAGVLLKQQMKGTDDERTKQLLKDYLDLQDFVSKAKGAGMSDKEVNTAVMPLVKNLFSEPWKMEVLGKSFQDIERVIGATKPSPESIKNLAEARAYGANVDLPGEQAAPSISPTMGALGAGTQESIPTSPSISSPSIPSQQTQQTMGLDKWSYDIGPYKFDYKALQTPQEREQEMKKSAEQQKQKDILKTSQDTARAEIAIGTAIDKWLDNSVYIYQEFGIRPGGITGGIMSKILGKTRANPHWEAFQGSLVDYGASVARIAMPGIRAARAINMFRTTAASDWSTIDSGIENFAASFRGAIGKDLAVHPEEYRDVLGEDYFSVDHVERSERRDAFLRLMEYKYKEGIYRQVYLREPNLVPKKWKDKFNIETSDNLKRYNEDPTRFLKLPE